MNWQRLLIVLFIFPVNYLAGQEFAERNFDRYTREEGMSHHNVSGLAQDSMGYIWIATTSGLNRYNGSRFLQFHSNNDSLSLPSEELSGVDWLNKELLAVYASGLYITNTRTGESRNLFIPYHNKIYQYKFNMIVRAKGDDEGNIFVLSRSGFYHFDKNHNLLFRYDHYDSIDVATSHFFFGRDLLELDDERLMIISIAGLFEYNKKKKQFRKIEPADVPLLAEFMDYPGSWGTGYQFFQPKRGVFFVMKVASDTLVYVNLPENKKTVTRLPFASLQDEFRFRSRMTMVNDTLCYITGHFSGFFKMRFYPETGNVKLYPEKFFSAYYCNAILTDKENNLWVATSKGLFRQNPERSQVQVSLLPKSIEDSFPNVRVDDIYVTSDKVYAAGRGQAGLLIFDKKTFQFDRQLRFTKYNNRGNTINAITAIDSSHFMMTTDWPLILFNHRTKKDFEISPPKWGDGDWANDLFRDPKGNIWVSAFFTQYYNPATRKYTRIRLEPRLLIVPFVIEGDKLGNIWMSGHGLARYNTTLDSFDLFLDSFPYIKMPDKQINALAIDHLNNVWLNSNNNGLIHFDVNKHTFRHFTRKDGLPDDNIASLTVIGKTLWIACYSGIACMDIQTSRIISFGKEDGFPEMQVVKGARFFYDSITQQLYLGFSNAVARFNPHYMLRRKLSPHVFIENVVINGKKNYFLPTQKLFTSWRDNEIMISIGSVNFSDSYTQRFAYRIYKDEHSQWQELGSQPSFNISNLSPGDYRIQVKTFSVNNRWPQQVKEINIVILPPFWQETWFILIMAAAVFMLLYLYVRWRTGLARKKEMEKTNIEKLKADDYKSQFELEQISNYFSSSLVGKDKKDEVLWDVTNNLISKMDYVDCMIYLWNEDKTKMVQKAAFGPKGKPEFISANVFEVLPGQGIVGHVIESLQPILVTDTRIDGRYRMDEEFRLSEICVPIIHNGELMGIIDSEHYEPGYFKERDIKILTTIATLIANKLKQIESEQSLEATHKELTTINEQLAEAKLSALQAQMNPHFVFNALNSIKRMILDGDNEKASRYLSKFALMIRMTLNHSKDVFVTLNENIVYLKTYLEMEQLRFDDSFTFSILTGENIDAAETAIPSLMIQPLVENAIWHGLIPSEADKKIMIAFNLNGQKIKCTIEDNGIGIRESEKQKTMNRPLHHSLGLENLQKRIKIMNEKYETDCSLEITDLKAEGLNGSGTRVVLQFNVINI